MRRQFFRTGKGTKKRHRFDVWAVKVKSAEGVITKVAGPEAIGGADRFV